MVIADGRIADFLINRDSRTGYAEFLFVSDYTEDCPRFTALCRGNIPDVAPGVPLKAEFQAEEMKDIITVDFRKYPVSRITREYKESRMNRLLYVSVNYNDETYAVKLLTQVKGITSRTAVKILDAVDGDVSRLAEHWDDREFWAQFKGSSRYLQALKESIGSILEQDGLVKKYGRYGVGYPQAGTLLSVYGSEAEQRLLQNPYRALRTADVSFQAADHLAKDLGFSYLSQQRLRAMIVKVLEDNESRGSTAMPEEEFYLRCADLHRYSAWKDRAVPPYFLLAAVTKMSGVYEDNGLIGFQSTAEKEEDIAFHLRRLSEADTNLKLTRKDLESLDGEYNQEQIEFLNEFGKHSVVALLGRGGTGKTHSVCGAISLFQKKRPKEEIRLCAPTARAAGVLKEHSGHQASTIHVMLELAPYGSEKEAGKNENTPLDEKLIVVDEMSMVDTDLMCSLLKAVKTGSKLILCGDPDQLSSVGCGAVLRDIVRSQAVPVVRLTRIMRQNEGSAVIENCGRILAGRSDFVRNENFRIRECASDKEAAEYLKSCYDRDSAHSQIITTTKKGPAGTAAVNRYFEKTGGECVYLHGWFFHEGDKVIFTRNNYQEGYCNGDVGTIVSVSPVTVRLDDGTEIPVGDEASADLEHADAVTIHKSQGSEYDKVYILLPEKPASLLTRNMVNTAVSRARREVTLITAGNALKTAASDIYKRYRVTRLEEKMRNLKGEDQCREKTASL